MRAYKREKKKIGKIGSNEKLGKSILRIAYILFKPKQINKYVFLAK